jgi:Fur family zinc uptake transcriptional regulator
MTAYIEQALQILKQKGFRLTQPRRHVLEALAQATEPRSPYELTDWLAGHGQKVDTVSIYRILECLEDLGLVHRVLGTGKVLKCSLEGEETCTRHQADHCHHLLICRQCQRIAEVHCPGFESIMAQVSAESRFRIEAHHLEFLGLCEPCSQAMSDNPN